MKKRIMTVLLIVSLAVGMVPMSTAAERTFVINGQTVTKNTGWGGAPAGGYNCSAYVSNLVANIYPKKEGFPIQFTSTYNILRNKSDTEREVTTAHVKEFIQSVQPGARIRVCQSSDTTSNDKDCGYGHTILLAAKNDAAGTFTTLESVVIGRRYQPQVYDYTYESFAQKFHDKYASDYSAGYNAKYFYYIYDLQRHFGTVDSTTPSGPSTLAITSPNTPSGTLKQGSYFGLTGTFSSNYNITSIYGRIVDNNTGSTVDSYTQRNVGKLYTLAYNTMDNNLEFNLLTPGAYYLSYEIKDESGKTASWKSGVFYVKGSTPCKTHTKGTYKFPEAKHPHYQYWECAVCGNNFTDGSTKKLDSCTVCNPPKPNCDKGHTWGGWTVTKNASCGVAGQQQRTCSICGTKETQTIAALSHTWGNWSTTKNASCGVAGEQQRKCSRCGKTETKTIDALGHNYKLTSSTITQKIYTCSRCGDTYNESTGYSCETNGHQWGTWKTTREATCEDEGRQERVCSVCGTTEKQILSTLPHSPGGWQVTLEPTCVEEGRRERICSECGRVVESEDIAATGVHDHDPQTGICRNCGARKRGGFPFSTVNDFYSWTFDDVGYGDWFYQNVSTAYELGLMKGTGAGTFSPGNNVTLAEAITLAARIHSIYHTGGENFPSYDGGNWYDPYVDYAGKNGIVNTYYNYARPATREEFVHILAKALPKAELANITGGVVFADEYDITYAEDVALLSGAGVINGISENGRTYFKPWNTITRAEVAAVIGRMAQPDTRIGAADVALSAAGSGSSLAGNGGFAVSTAHLNGERAPGNQTKPTNGPEPESQASASKPSQSTESTLPEIQIDPNRETYGAGICGENLRWVLYTDGELVVYGKGEMEAEPPWTSGSYCGLVTSATISEGILNVSEGAFGGCNFLKRVSLPNSLVRIDSLAFNHTALTDITIPDRVTFIDLFAFRGCKNLISVTIPSSVKYIEGYSFSLDETPNLSQVYYTGTEQQWADIAIAEGNSSLTVATIHYNSAGN